MPAINFVPNERGFLFLEMKIKGENHIFLLDTGAEGTLLTPELIKEFPVHKMLISGGVGGSNLSHTVLISFNLLGKTVREIGQATFLEGLSKELGFKVSGLIGQDLLRQFLSYTIDNKKGQFIFTL